MADPMAPIEWVGRRLRTRSFPYAPPLTPTSVEPEESPSKTGLDFDTEWARSGPAQMGRRMVRQSLVRPAIAAVASPTVVGAKRLERLNKLDRADARDGTRRAGRGNAVFIANHHSHADVALVLDSLPAPWCNELVVAAAADYFFTNRVSSAASSFVLNAIPIERNRVNRRSGETAAELIDQGWSLLIFPEGGRSPDGWGQDFKGGAAYLALKTGVPVVPLHIEGTDRIWPKGQRLPKRGSATVTIGDPIVAHEKESSRSLTERLGAAVTALADEADTDWWQARRRAHQNESPELTGPSGPAWRRAWARDTKSDQVLRKWPK